MFCFCKHNLFILIQPRHGIFDDPFFRLMGRAKSVAEPYRLGFLLKHSDFTCTVCILFMTLQPNALNSTYRQDTSHFDLVHKLPHGQTKLCKGPHRHRLNHVGSYCVHAALVTVFVWSHNQTPPQSKPRSGFLHSLHW